MSKTSSSPEKITEKLPIAIQSTSNDIELLDTESQLPTNLTTGVLGKVKQYSEKTENYLAKYSLEARGIQRVEPHESHDVTWKSYMQAFQIFFSINLAAFNPTIGMLAPVVYGLSFKDASLCAVFGSFLGSLAAVYIAPFGALSGLRSLVRLIQLLR